MKNNLLNYDFPSELKTMKPKDLTLLASLIRDFLIENISKTGGHLASNLGIVELSIALHRVFDSPDDKIIWDVGHQCYVHKILTGRANEFGGLRQYGGISGFPKRSESLHDVFNSGHSSNSISAAMGFAEARDISGGANKATARDITGGANKATARDITGGADKAAARDLTGGADHVVAVIGDGALTGGQAYEGLNNVGNRNTKIIVILNDNEMSISRNTGGISHHLSHLRTSKKYLDIKKKIKRVLKSIPGIGGGLYSGAEYVRDLLKFLTMQSGAVFESLGFKYFGPVDGHNIDDLTEVLTVSRLIETPVFIHVITKKGKGYRNAENNPDKFHGIGPFEPLLGGQITSETGTGCSECFGEKLTKMAEIDRDITAITAAMKDGTGLKVFAAAWPERFFDIGIAEAHAVTFAAGLALAGFKPYVAIYSSFLQRAYDQILIDVCLQKLPVTFCVDRAGITGADGETHHGLFDISYFNHMPGISVLAPANNRELELALEYSRTFGRPLVIRYPRCWDTAGTVDGVDVAADRAGVATTGADVSADGVGAAADRANVAAAGVDVAADRADVATAGADVAADGADVAADDAAAEQNNTADIAAESTIVEKNEYTYIYNAEKIDCADITISDIMYGKSIRKREGTDIDIWAVGSTANEAGKLCALLKNSGISAGLVNPLFVKPFDTDEIVNSVKTYKNLLTLEDNVAAGGFGESVSAFLTRERLTDVGLLIKAWPNEAIVHGETGELRKKYGMDAETIADEVVKFLENKKRQI